ncbi:unnamed protein product [Arabidopsis thaliana]|uniref:(thale cress) hypothetical protein n=1 Tax=Arabidopsis thaliana TaxID=3702 RepID=A0A178VHA1_ARATH|nr:hypothetical protein AXX17_AT3G08080 [Arabidopsis thaliana]CAD5322429.1 unnamed protein product [Arabidopsis thaliana]
MASGYNQYTAMAVFATMTLSSVFTASAQYDSESQTGASCFPGMSIIMIISSLILSGFAILRW